GTTVPRVPSCAPQSYCSCRPPRFRSQELRKPTVRLGESTRQYLPGPPIHRRIRAGVGLADGAEREPSESQELDDPFQRAPGIGEEVLAAHDEESLSREQPHPPFELFGVEPPSEVRVAPERLTVALVAGGGHERF